MAEPGEPVQMSAAEYLVWERAQTDKHEFHLGVVFAMAGGSPRHNLLSNAVGAELRTATRKNGCHVLSSDQRIAAPADKRYLYADAVVVCGALRLEPGTSDVLVNPSVVVEVVSPSTEAYDRGTKWDAYRRLESLTDYLLVSQTAAHVEHSRRAEDGTWRYSVLEAGETVLLADGITLEVDAIYEGAFDLAFG